MLGGTSFNNILQKLGLDCEQEQDLSVLDPIATLRTLLHNAKECIQKKKKDYEALECLISVSLIVSLYFADSDLAAQVSLPDLLKWSKTMYAIRKQQIHAARTVFILRNVTLAENWRLRRSKINFRSDNLLERVVLS